MKRLSKSKKSVKRLLKGTGDVNWTSFGQFSSLLSHSTSGDAPPAAWEEPHTPAPVQEQPLPCTAPFAPVAQLRGPSSIPGTYSSGFCLSFFFFAQRSAKFPLPSENKHTPFGKGKNGSKGENPVTCPKHARMIRALTYRVWLSLLICFQA